MVFCFCLFVWFDSLRSINNLSVMKEKALPGLNQYSARINMSCSRTQRSDAGGGVCVSGDYYVLTSVAARTSFIGQF